MTTSFFHRLTQLLQRGMTGILLASSAMAWAQFRVEVSGVGLTQLPIAVATFRGDDAAPQKMGAIIRADLERSGQFRVVDTANAIIDELAQPEVSTWRQKGADSLVTGSVTRLADGRYDVRFRLWDVVCSQGQQLIGIQSFTVLQGDLRVVAHRISDMVFEKLTGERGVFSTSIAYVTKEGSRYNLWVADSDGEGAQSALASSEPIISPAWSPNGTQLAYVSFEARKPQELATKKRRFIADFRGSNSAPAWLPDGKSLAVTLSRDGGSQLYTIDANGGLPRSQIALIQSLNFPRLERAFTL
jgi:TolB protein